MVSEDTLQIKNFPPELTDAEKEEFLLHFGATNVRIITSKIKRNSVSYARFKSKEVARNVMCSLHQIRVLNHYLSVKYAEHASLGEPPGEPKCVSSALLGTIASTDDENKKHYKSFVNRMHAFNRWVGFNQPTPSHLKYSYPGPNRATINNIAHALASVPKFYTQVLHLMNRMNFPPPFANEAPPPVAILSQPPPSIVAMPQPPLPPKIRGSDEEESEMESDPDSPGRPKEVIPVAATKRQQSITQTSKIVKRPKLTIQPINEGRIIQNIEMAQKQQKESSDDVFERVEAILPAVKRIELKLTTDNLRRLTNPPEYVSEPPESFDFQPMVEQERHEDDEDIPMIDPEVKRLDLQLTTDSLDKMAQAMEANMEAEEERVALAEMAEQQEEEEELVKLTPDEISGLAVFRNYQPGPPTAKLYIKNISKTVDTARLDRLFRRFNADPTVTIDTVCTTEESPMFDVRLMQEGRMKGQAFITFCSVAAAERALVETNGIVLDDKPLVVVFGKVPPLPTAVKKVVTELSG